MRKDIFWGPSKQVIFLNPFSMHVHTFLELDLPHRKSGFDLTEALSSGNFIKN